MTLASRMARVAPSPTLKVAAEADRLRRAGVDVVDFGAGEPDFASPSVAVEAARRALADGFTKYTPNAGIPALRRAVADRYRRDHVAPWVADETMISFGGKVRAAEAQAACR